MHYRNLTQRYEINKIVREDKITKRSEIIYQSTSAEEREKAEIEKMLSDSDTLMKKCLNKRDEALVKDFISLWRQSKDGI